MDDAMNSTVLPPLKAVTATDQGGVVAITASLGLVFGVISLLIRTYVRIECRAPFRYDDYAAFASMVAALVQGVLVFLAIGRGFGRAAADLAAGAVQAWERDLYASDAFFVVGLWLTKSSIALLLLRLSRDPAHGVLARVLLAASAVYLVVALFVVLLRCDLARPWDLDVPGCATSTYARWTAVTVMDMVTEVALFVGGLWLVRDVQLAWRKKSMVAVAYGLRLPVMLAAGFRLYYVRRAVYSDDRSLHGVLAAVCTQIELAYAVIATTMPCLKPFMSALNTRYGGGNNFVLTQTSASSSAQRSRERGGGKTLASQKVRGGGTQASGGSGGVASALASKGRRSTESETGILEEEQQKARGDSASLSGADVPAIREASTAVTTTNTRTTLTQTTTATTPGALPRSTKTTSISSTRSPYDRRRERERERTAARLGGAQSPTPNAVAVTVDITVVEEKDMLAAEGAAEAEAPTPGSPVAAAAYRPSVDRARIGQAE